jgi:hypothetical protein
VPYLLHLVDDDFLLAQKLYHPDLSGSTRFFIFLGGGSRCVNVFLAQECVWMSMVEGGAPGKECGVFRKGMTPGGNAGWYKYHFL